mgnify:CR=1 FL=1
MDVTIREDGELSDRVIMVSGGSRGLGRALARRYVEEGASVSICARNEADLGQVADHIRAAGGRCLAIPADVSSADDVERWFEATSATFGRVDAVVNNASVLGPLVPVEEHPEDAWRRVIDVNLTGAFLCARTAVPRLRRTAGSLIHVSSGVGDHGRPEWGAYSVSKNGLEALSEMLAGELADDGVRSNVVDPGAMRTEMRAAAYPEEDPRELPPPYRITDVFVYLASDRSGDVTGERFRAPDFEMPDD